MAKFKLTINFEIAQENVDENEITENLFQIVKQAMANGSFTGDTEYRLDGFDYSIENSKGITDTEADRPACCLKFS